MKTFKTVSYIAKIAGFLNLCCIIFCLVSEQLTTATLLIINFIQVSVIASYLLTSYINIFKYRSSRKDSSRTLLSEYNSKFLKEYIVLNILATSIGGMAVISIYFDHAYSISNSQILFYSAVLWLMYLYITYINSKRIKESMIN